MDEWVKFIAHSLDKRLESSSFQKFVRVVKTQHPLPPAFVADALLKPTNRSGQSLDPKISQYAQILLNEDVVDLPSLLRALLKYSTFQSNDTLKERSGHNKGPLLWQNSYLHEEDLMYGFAKLVSAGTRPQSTDEIVGSIQSLTEWIKVLTLAGATNEMLQQLGASNVLPDQHAATVSIPLGTLIAAMAENVKVNAFLERGCPKDVLKTFSDSLSSFVLLMSSTSSMIAERLEIFRTQRLATLLSVSQKGKSSEDDIGQILESTITLDMESLNVVDLPIMNCRAGLYIYLNSLLVGKPIVDDTAVFNYLHNRYQGDIQNTCIDLVVSSFDVLANAIFRNELAHVTIVLRSFLINKVPLFLAALSSSMFPPLTPEFCITEALGQVDTNAFPTFSSMFDESSSNNSFSDSVRQDFCFACCLHGLIAEESIERLLGEIPMQTLPAGGRYAKDDLVQQCLSDPERTESLLDELEHMDGNVGAVSQAITEIIGHLCRNKETTSLKTLCTHLGRKPSSFDIMLLFNKTSAILQPICELLDGWRYDEDQGEYQPVYEEFGSILLLVLAFVYRYHLSTVDLGLQASDSFIMRLLVKGAISRPMIELSEQEKNHLDGWIRGLFNAEGGGLGDEPMSNCPPQEFYLLVPSLFNQVLLAYSTGHLNDEILKNGLEYLVHTFLLPSLVGAMMWLSNHLWEGRGDANAIIQILQIVVNPESITNDGSSMLGSVLNIIAKPLEHSLRWLQRSEPTRQDIEPLSRALKPHLSFSRTAGSDHTELELWANYPGGGMAASIRHTISSLVQWSLASGSNVMPTSYTHRQILVGIRVLGAKRLLNTIVDEVKLETANGNSAVVFDVAASFICAPDAGSASASTSTAIISMLDDNTSSPQPLQRRLTLRDALRTAAEDAPRIYKDDVLQAETLVRLYRRVEAQLAIAIPMEIPQQAGLLGVHDGLGGLDVDNTTALDVGVGGMMGSTQEMEDAMMADGNIMDALAGDHDMMGLGDDDLLGDMKLDF